MRTFVIGDIHGAAKALEQCLERSGFDKDNDLLITLGDICDGWPYVYECVDILLSCKNRIDIIGNHDEWFSRWMDTGIHFDNWRQGGAGTARSYLRQIDKEDLIQRKDSGYITALNPGDIPQSHIDLFKQQILYLERDRKLFVHAGFDRMNLIEDQSQYNKEMLYWDRELWKQARSCKNHVRLTTCDGFEKIFIGHTTCSHIDNMKPIFSGGIWNLDTGAGWEGKLTIMNVDTEEYFQSDLVVNLYPDDAGRR